MMSCAGGLERKNSASLGNIMRMVIPRYVLRSHGAVGFPNRCCSEVFAFGVDPTEMIPGRSDSATTIQFTGGRSAYNVVDEAS